MPKQSFVAPALQAYLSVSADSRAEQQVAGQNFDRNQNTFLKLREDQRRGEAQDFDEKVGLQKLGAFMEEADYQRRVMRPLKEDAARFALEQQRAKVQQAADEQNTDRAIIGDFQLDVARLRGVMNGEIDASLPVSEIRNQTTYINKVTGEPVIAMDKGEGLMLFGKNGVPVKTDTKNLRKVKSFDAGDPVMRSIDDILDETKLEGSDEIVRAQNGLALLEEMQQKAVSSPRHAKLIANQVKLLSENMGRSPHVSFLQQEGNTLPPDLRERRQRQGEASVQGALRAMLGDKKAEEWAAENPRSVRDMAFLTPAQQFAQAETISKRLDAQDKIARGSLKPQTLSPNERAAQKIHREITVSKTLIKNKFAELQAEKGRPIDTSDPRDAKVKRDKIQEISEELIKLNADSAKLEAELGSYKDAVTTDGPLGTTIELPTGGGAIPTQTVDEFFAK